MHSNMRTAIRPLETDRTLATLYRKAAEHLTSNSGQDRNKLVSQLLIEADNLEKEQNETDKADEQKYIETFKNCSNSVQLKTERKP
jgi:hypothetical protein